MSDANNIRKLRHVRAIQGDPASDRQKFYFDDVRLKHRALPELDLAKIDPSVRFMGKRLSFPLLISSMTGGDHPELRKINRNLAIAAEKTGVAMGVGSQRVMFSLAAARSSFDLRELAPSALLFANLGAVQLNCGFGIRECREAVKTAGADALYLHLNPLQEAVQTGGNTNFAGLASKIANVVEQLPVPVVIKEVGAGVAAADVRLLVKAGIRFVDVAGAGGTSWSRIEHHAQTGGQRHELGLLFQDWGISTPDALKALKSFRPGLTLIASGGLRSGVDMAKAMVLGASLCGMASPFLEPARKSAAAVIDVIEMLKREFTTAQFLLGVPRAKDLIGNDGLLQ